jgi:hypothetical protein
MSKRIGIDVGGTSLALQFFRFRPVQGGAGPARRDKRRVRRGTAVGLEREHFWMKHSATFSLPLAGRDKGRGSLRNINFLSDLSFDSTSPPPLTPPHKWEGDNRMDRSNRSSFYGFSHLPLFSERKKASMILLFWMASSTPHTSFSWPRSTRPKASACNCYWSATGSSYQVPSFMVIPWTK